MIDDMHICEEFFSSVLTDTNIDILNRPAEQCFHPQNLFDFKGADLAYNQNKNAFLNAYQGAVASFLEDIKDDNSPNVAQHALVLLKLVDINVTFGIDLKSLADLLIALSNKSALLLTAYAHHKYGDCFLGIRIAGNLEIVVNGILTRECPEAEKNRIVDAVSQIPVTNVTLAGWNDYVLKHYGMKPAKKATQANRACTLYDRLLGSGIKDLLLNNPQEKVEKRLKPFDDVGLQEVSQKILAFYACRTGNEKRRFLSDIEKEFSSADIFDGINRFLREG